MLNIFPDHILLLIQRVTGGQVSPAGCYVFLRLLGKCLNEGAWELSASAVSLAAEFGCAVNTLLKGSAELEAGGILVRSKAVSRREPILYRWVSASPTLQAQATTVFDAGDLKNIIESLLFCSGNPLSAERICGITGAAPQDIAVRLAELAKEYVSRPIQLTGTALGFILSTRPEYAQYVKQIAKPASKRLSGAELETLAVIFFKGPVSRQTISKIRSADSFRAVNSLVKAGFIYSVKSASGDFLYLPAQKAIAHFGLNSISDLQGLREQV